MSGLMRRCGDCKHFEHELWRCLRYNRDKSVSSRGDGCFEDANPEMSQFCLNCEKFGGQSSSGTHFRCMEQGNIWTCYLPVRRDCEKLANFNPGAPFHEFSFLDGGKLNRKIVRLS